MTLQDIKKAYANWSSNCYWSSSSELFKPERTHKLYSPGFYEAYYPKWVNLKTIVVRACYIWLGPAIVRSRSRIQWSHGFSSSQYRLIQTRSVTLQLPMTFLYMYVHSLSEFDYQDIYFLSPTKYFYLRKIPCLSIFQPVIISSRGKSCKLQRDWSWERKTCASVKSTGIQLFQRNASILKYLNHTWILKKMHQ